MKCTYCESEDTKVVDSRESEGSIRRRRECIECGERFTTYESPESLDATVIKEDGERQEFSEEKVREGVEKAAKNTSLTGEDVEKVVESVKGIARGRKQIASKKIGDVIKEELSTKDEVAYIRFTSVYDSFENAESFKEAVESLKSK